MTHVEVLSPVMDETMKSSHANDIKSRLNEKLFEGDSLLDTPCPPCVVPTMIRSPERERPVSKETSPHFFMSSTMVQPQSSSLILISSRSFEANSSLTFDADMMALDQGDSLKDQRSIVVVMEENRENLNTTSIEVKLSEHSSSMLAMAFPYAREEQEDPTLDAMDKRCIFMEQDATPRLDVHTSIKEPWSLEMQPNPLPDKDVERDEGPTFDISEEHRDVTTDVPLRKMDTKEELDNIVSIATAFMRGKTSQTITPPPETVTIIIPSDEPVLSLTKQALFLNEPGDEKEGIIEHHDEHCEDKCKTESLIEAAVRLAMLSPRSVKSDLLDPTEMEELEYECAKSIYATSVEPSAEASDDSVVVIDEIMKEYSIRRDIATKVLGSKMLQGYSLLKIQCLKCGMPLMEYKDQIDCVVCPVLVKKAMEKMKEERIRAEQKAIIEALVAAEQKADEEAVAMAKAEKEAAEAKAKAEEEAAAKAAAEAEEVATKAAAAEEARRMEAEEVAIQAAAEAEATIKATEEAVVEARAEEEAARLASEELELTFAFTNEEALRLEEETRLAEEERLDSNTASIDVQLSERSLLIMPTIVSFCAREEQEDPTFDAMEKRCIFMEQDATPRLDVHTSINVCKSRSLEIQPNPSPDNDDKRDEELTFDISEEHRDVIPVAPLRKMDTKEELDNIVSIAAAFMRGKTTQTITPSPETDPIIIPSEEPILSFTKKALFPSEPADEKEGIIEHHDEYFEDRCKMESLIDTAVSFTMLPPKPVESDLLDPTEKEELEHERAKSIYATSVEPSAEASDDSIVVTDEIMKEYSIRRDIATKVLGSKMLQGYSLVKIQCLKCGMPLMEYKDQIDCVVCPVLANKAMEKMKEQEEERIRAELKAIIEALVAAEQKADEEAVAMAKAEKEAAEARAKAEEEATAKAAAEAEEAAIKAAAAEEARRMEAEEASMRAAAEEAAIKATEEAVVKARDEEEAASLASGELELTFAFSNEEEALRLEEEARLAEEERLDLNTTSIDVQLSERSLSIMSAIASTPLLNVYTTIKKPRSLEIQPNLLPDKDNEGEEEPTVDINEEHRDVTTNALLSKMDTEKELDTTASMATALMHGKSTETIIPSPETIPIIMHSQEPVLSLTKQALFFNEPGDEKEGIIEHYDEYCGDKCKMESLIETAVSFALLPPRPVKSDLLDPTEMEELEYERAKSMHASSVESPSAEASDDFVVVTDEIMKEYSIRRDIATKVLGSKMLQGYSLVKIQCLKCGMPLMKYKDQIDCVVCPVLAMEKMKEEEEERIRAELKAIIEALVAAEQKADEEAAAMAKAEKEAAEAKAKAEEEAAAKAAAEAEEAAIKAAAAEEARRMKAEEAAMRAAAEEEAAIKAKEKAVAKARDEEEVANLAAEELELMFAFTDEEALRVEEETRLAEEEGLLEQARLAKEDGEHFCVASFHDPPILIRRLR